MKEALTNLKNNAPSLLEVEVGINISEHKDAYDIVFIGCFATRSDLNDFDKDEAHGKVGDLVRKIKEHRTVIEYEI